MYKNDIVNMTPPIDKPSNTAASQGRILAFFRRFVQHLTMWGGVVNKPSMKYTLPLLGLLLLLPFVSYAATLTPYQTDLLKMISLLEEEIQILQIQPAQPVLGTTQVATSTATSTIQNNSCKPYTSSAPIGKGKDAIFPIVGTECVRQATGGTACGC